MSKCIINVGMTGSGKTTVTKKILSQIEIPIYIFDVNREYSEFKNLNTNHDNFNNFVAMANTRIKSCVIYEEATIFFSHSGCTENIKSQLVRKRHTGNLFVFNFHSMRQVPLFLLDFCDLLILGQTNDTGKLIMDKFKYNENIINAFEELKAENNIYAKRYIQKIN